ncbi:hypothetical protein SAMN05216252_13379 [Actinacidiphila glaucinigra]|uniref:Uncharacterized protein n=1 Tax=Actinacidiphila glaucinigra TaxID=235986 RepID=A0A239ND47_9ACTN|nr:hypothetical protein SAMN05216252_13379 [Actinacidiphila glaucinigra]
MVALARHRVDPPRLGVDPDAGWRAAALLQTLLLRPLPALNARYACAVVIAFMHAIGEGLSTPYGELVELCKDLMARRLTRAAFRGASRSVASCSHPHVPVATHGVLGSRRTRMVNRRGRFADALLNSPRLCAFDVRGTRSGSRPGLQLVDH